MISFAKWLKHQGNRQDNVGAFARSGYKPTGRGRVTRKSLGDELMIKAADSATFAAFNAAFDDYERCAAAASGGKTE